MKALFRLPETWLLVAIVAIMTILAFGGPAHANGSDHHNGGTVNVENDNRSDANADARADADARSESRSSSDVDVDSHNVYKGDDYEAAASSASIFLEGCGSGAAAQGVGFGAALGSESRVCQLLRVAAAHQALGMHYEASVIVRQALTEIYGGGQRPEEAPPLMRASDFLKQHLIRPLFSLLPFVGQGA